MVKDIQIQQYQRGNKNDIEQDRCRRRRREFLHRVQHATHQGDQRHECQIGKRDSRQFNCEFELFRMTDKSGRDQVHQYWHRNDRQQRKGQ